ncbi:MAG: nitrile hydratase accessory protein [Chloroflexi bacterium]|nr:nitrile hydratase accessory protein [Chloroflexota bacterium]
MIERSVAEPEGAPLPRKNGELVFEAPWEGRAFGLAVLLNERGQYEWNAFRDKLIAEISDDRAYYESWLTALENVLLSRGLVDRAELSARTEAIRSGERDDVF